MSYDRLAYCLVSDTTAECMDLSGIDFDDEVEEVKKVEVKREPKKHVPEKPRSVVT